MLETGTFYHTIIDPLIGTFRKRIALEINEGERVIDVACGTGAQLFDVAGKAASATGIDLSESMIRFAQKEAAKRNISNTSFIVADATDLSICYKQKYDVAILSLALHQFSPELQQPVLSEIKKITNKIIVLDYAAPLPKNCMGFTSKMVEFLAGIKHNQNFKSYIKAGGLDVILPANGFSFQKLKLMGKGAFQLAVAQKNDT